METEFATASERRRATLLAHSTEVLSELPHTFGTQSFILSEGEALRVGEAIHSRNHRAIQKTIGSVQEAAIKDYTETAAIECVGMWNGAFENIFGKGTTINELLLTPETRELLNIALTHSSSTQLGLDTTEYVKLLESIAIVTMPVDGFKNYQDNRRKRLGGSLSAIYNRTISLLDSCANAEPGIRTMREDILTGDTSALEKYLASSVKAKYAQESLAKIIELDADAVLREKNELSYVLLDRKTEDEIEVDELLHVLSWTMLNGRDDDRETKHRRIRKIIENQSQTDFQKERVKRAWCPERLDFLIEIAEGAVKEGRKANMYISNRFEDGAGVYVAVELDNPNDSNSKIVFADNPIAGNALYVVDEARLANEGRENSWLNVLGASRRIARERGAIRKYHTKNWKDILPQILSMGDQPSENQVTPQRHVATQTESTEYLDPVTAKLLEAYRVQQRAKLAIAATEKLLHL